MHVLHYANELLRLSDFPVKNFANSLNMQKQCKKMSEKRIITSTLVDKSTDHDEPHFDLFFYHNINVKDFCSERELN